MANVKFKVLGVWHTIPSIKGEKGDAGDALPIGGTVGQVLMKNSSTDNDATWKNPVTNYTEKTTPVNADLVLIADSADSNNPKKLSWTNIKAFLKTYFDTLYNNYVHPANHPASIITQDASNRFVTDTEKTTWNSKANGTHTHATSDVTGLDTALSGKASSIHTHAISDVTGLQTALDGKSAKSTVENKTLLASGWTGASAPFSQDIAVTGVTATSFQEWLESLTITSAELLALQSANIIDGGQSTGTVTFKAFGVKPTIDIPIRVIKRGD